MTNQTQYKTSLVTGASAGFGWEIAITLANLGINVIACGRRLDRLEELSAQYPLITPYQLDVTDLEQIERLHSDLQKRNQLPDILVNNAGLALGLGSADNCDLRDWEAMVDTNIKGLMYCTRIFTPSMREKNNGYVINIGSIAGNWPYPGSNTYGGTKAFVSQFSKNLRSDFIGTSIRVTCLEPGIAETEFSVVRFKGSQDKADAVYKNTKPLVAKDIADIIGWLVSLPGHINVNTLEVMPTFQAWAPLTIHRS